MTKPPSGIYKITNLANGKIYVGQSKNIFERRKEHFNALYRGQHVNREMQADWNKYSKWFRWDVLEYCGLVELNEREKYWIEKLDTMSPRGYNLDWVPYKRKPEKRPPPSYRKKGYRKSS